jgi:cytochrome c-type biogenesis protein CcmI
MTFSFVVPAFLMLLAACLFVFLPVMREKRVAKRKQASSQALNVLLTKQRLRELEDEIKQGLLSEDALALAEDELKVALVSESQEPQPIKANSPIKWIVSVGIVVSVIVSSAVYWRVNQLSKITHWHETVANAEDLKQALGNSSADSIGVSELREVALVLRTTLIDNPTDDRRWHMLGRVFMALQRPDLAGEALKKSLSINQSDLDAMMTYSQVLITLGDEFSLVEAKDWLLRVINEKPESQQAWGLLAVAATSLGDSELAKRCWQMLANIIDPNDPSYALVQRQLQDAQAEDNTAKTGFSISVDLSDDLREKLPSEAFLFVFAQDNKSNVKMPAAVVKMPLTQFPLNVELSEANAMIPSYNLTQLEQVKLIARISLDENVATSFGEMQGEVIADVVKGNQISKTILIDQELL